MTYYIHTRANGFRRWVCLDRRSTKAAAHERLAELVQQDDPTWQAAEYLISDSRRPLDSQAGFWVDGAVRFRAELADGRVLTGPVRGFGGLLGMAALHAGPEVARRYAFNRLRVAVKMAARGRRTGIFEPSPGHAGMLPRYSGAEDGERIDVPLVGTTWTVLGTTGRPMQLYSTTCHHTADNQGLCHRCGIPLNPDRMET